MVQKNIRNFNGMEFSVAEAAEWHKEFNDRTRSLQNGYNSIDELATKLKALELTAQTLKITDISGLQAALGSKENAFIKNTAFNKNFGTTVGTVAVGDHKHDDRYYSKIQSDTKYTLKALTINSGTGLSGGGKLQADMTLNVGSRVVPLTAYKLPGGQNLNDFGPGFYYQDYNNRAASGVNYPVSQAGSLVVQTSAGLTQQYYTYNDGSPEIYFRAYYSANKWSPWHKVYHSGNDGANSGLDADKLDGLESSAFIRKGVNASNAWNGQYLIFSYSDSNNVDAISYNDATNSYYFNADTIKNNSSANAGIFAGNFNLVNAKTRLTKGDNDSLKITTPYGYLDFAPKNTAYCHFKTDRDTFYFNKELCVDSGIVRSYSQDLNLNRTWSETARIIIAGGITYSDQNLGFRNGARIRRYNHVGGFLEGSYNTVGANSEKTNPIYTIGSSYIPSENTLGNMYGIGFSHGNASFLNASDLGVNPPADWGLYVAADGNARIFLNGSQGHGYFLGHLYANQGVFRGNVTGSSDKRLKTNIKPIPDALEKVLKLNGCTWDRKDMELSQAGVIAQNLKEVLPVAVTENEEGMLSVDQGNALSALLIEAIKQLKLMIDGLTK